MNDLRALRPAGLLLAMIGAVLLVLWLLAARDAASMLVPGPEQAAEQLISALGAHRYEAAHELLSEQARGQVTVDQLKELARSLERSRQGIEDAHGRADSVEERGDEASAKVKVSLADGQQKSVRLNLTKEHGLWKVDSIEPLRALGGE